MSLASVALLGALGLDVAFGEPPATAHPVRWFGNAIGHAERAWTNPLVVGLAAAVLLPVLAAAVTGLLVATAVTRTTVGGATVAAVVLFAATSYRELLTTVWGVCRRAETDLPGARRDLSALAGRDPAGFDAARIRSAALESLSENLADGLVAPLCGFVAGAAVGGALGVSAGWSLGLACAGATWIKAVNTMDSMWGYPDRPLGTGAARLDDLVMWVPARLTAALVAGAFLAPRAPVRARRWAASVPSPNAGWPMGTLAAAVGVRLEKPGRYVINPGARLPAPAHVAVALGRIGVAGLGAYALAGVMVWA